MIDTEKEQFFTLLQGVFAYHRQALSKALAEIYWRGCSRWRMEQVTKAFDSLTADPEAGKFLPKIGDLTRVLEGTHTDRSMIAWGKVFEAMSAVGAYQDVVFDDAAIHASVQDAGGWPKVCRSETNELGYVQTAFCKSHRAYVGRGTFDYPRMLSGDGGPDQAQRYAAKGLPPPLPVFVGDPTECAKVLAGGNAAGKTRITFTPGAALAHAAIGIPHRPVAEQHDDFIDAPVKRTGCASG